MPKQKSTKTCIKCRYFVKRRIGSIGTGMAISNYGKCEGNEMYDLTGRGAKHIGLVHKSMTCQLPNIGKPADWKPKFRVPASMKKLRFNEAHPGAFSKHYEGDAKWRRQREYALEQLEQEK